MALRMPMPPHTLVMARNSTMHTTDSDANAVFTFAFSCRSANMLSPRRYSGLISCTSFNRKPDSA